MLWGLVHSHETLKAAPEGGWLTEAKPVGLTAMKPDVDIGLGGGAATGGVWSMGIGVLIDAFKAVGGVHRWRSGWYSRWR